MSKNNKTKRHKVHRLVAQTFIPNPNNLPCVLHENDIKTDNRVSNLFWGTHQDNIEDKVKKGRQSKGSDQGNSILTEDLVRMIRKLRKETGEGCIKISRRLGLENHKAAVDNVIRGTVWKYLK